MWIYLQKWITNEYILLKYLYMCKYMHAHLCAMNMILYWHHCLMDAKLSSLKFWVDHVTIDQSQGNFVGDADFVSTRSDSDDHFFFLASLVQQKMIVVRYQQMVWHLSSITLVGDCLLPLESWKSCLLDSCNRKYKPILKVQKGSHGCWSCLWENWRVWLAATDLFCLAQLHCTFCSSTLSPNDLHWYGIYCN